MDSRTSVSEPSGPRLVSRRDLLIAGPVAALAGVLAWRAPKYDRARFAHAATSEVAILPAGRYDADLVDVISQGLKLLKVDVRGKRVLLKPNLVEFYPERVVNTDSSVIAAATEAFTRHGARSVVVAEGPGHRRDTEYLVTATGLFDRLSELRTAFVDLNQDDVRRVRLGSRFMGLRDLALPVSVLDADLVVSMPKLKTHHWAGMTCSLKNLFGVVPGAVYGWPKNLLHFRGIENSIVDLAATVRPGLAIVDGIVGMEGDGPIMGRARKVGAIVMGQDLVAVDATCARLIGLRPERMPYLATAGGFLGNLEEERISQQGEPLSRYATTFDIRPGLKTLQGRS
jgi:uncharacterized protein (DUF362 family)